MISLPNADGRIEQFELFEASNFEPELQAKYPQIRSFPAAALPIGTRPSSSVSLQMVSKRPSSVRITAY